MSNKGSANAHVSATILCTFSRCATSTGSDSAFAPPFSNAPNAFLVPSPLGPRAPEASNRRKVLSIIVESETVRSALSATIETWLLAS